MPETLNDLASAWAKLDRAQWHFDALRIELEPYHANSPISVRSVHNLEGTEQPIKIRYFVDRLEPIPPRWSVIVGDLIHNARSAIDNAAWTLMCAEKGVAFAQRNAYSVSYPIHWTIDKFRRSFMAQNLSGARRLAITEMQPYEREMEHPERDALWVLNKLSNIDKHQAFHIVTFIGMDSTVRTDPPLSEGEIRFVTKGPLSVGVEIMEFTATRPLLYCPIEVVNRITAQICLLAPENVNVPLDVGITELIKRAREVVNAVESAI